MFEFQDFLKIVLILLIAFISLTGIGLMILMLTDYTKKDTIERVFKREKINDFEKTFESRMCVWLPRFDKGKKIYIHHFNPFQEPTNIQTITTGIVIKPPNEAGYHEKEELYILEMEDGSYTKVPRGEIFERCWSTSREKFNEMIDNEPVSAEDE